MNKQKLKHLYFSLISTLLVFMNSEVTYGQEFPDYLRSNYVSTALIDTKGDDFGLAPMTKGYFVFCSNGRTGLGRILREPKIDLFLYDLKKNEISLFDKSGLCDLDDHRNNIGSVSFTSDLKTLFISRNRFQKNYNGIVPFELMQVDILEETSECSTLPFVNPDYSYQQPFFDSRQSVLYYISNVPGGKGGFDVYAAKRYADHTWSLPVNVESVNTSEDELFPTTDFDGNMFFSRRTENMGLDIFCLIKETTFPERLPGPFNTEGDDFNFVVIDSKNIVMSRVTKRNKSSDILLFSIFL